MKCPECGSEVGPEERFCGNCGAPIEREAAEPEGIEPAPTEETMLVETPPLLEEEVEDPTEEPPGEKAEFAPALPPAGAEEIVLPPEGEPAPPPVQEEEMVPPPASEEEIVPLPMEEPLPPAAGTGEEVAPPAVQTPRREDNRRIWIIVAIVVIVLALCCCVLLIATVLFFVPLDSASVILGRVAPHLL